ncbi:MAG: hypothetical protein FJW29_05365 [Acidobacteria bacterium]|nr:hypothetical protein [Acidobacteriota bacterium]
MRALAAALLLITLPASAVLARGPQDPGAAAAFDTKLGQIIARGPQTAGTHFTIFSNDELNAYLALSYASELPHGLSSPAVTLRDGGIVDITLVADLDRLAGRRSASGPFVPLALLKGQVPVNARGTFAAAEGQARFRLERAELAGFEIPPPLLQQLLSTYTATPDAPQGMKLDDPLPMPYGIRTVTIVAGRVIVTQ